MSENDDLTYQSNRKDLQTKNHQETAQQQGRSVGEGSSTQQSFDHDPSRNHSSGDKDGGPNEAKESEGFFGKSQNEVDR